MECRSRAIALARLFRLSIAGTPIADVLAGYVVFQQEFSFERAGLRLAAACLASVAVFCFGTALNDFLDQEKDRKLAPRRPLPSGGLSPGAALAAALSMAALALGLGLVAGLLTLAAVALVLMLAASYNLWARRSDWLGVLNLGLIRAADLFVGGSLVLAEAPVESWWSWTGQGMPAGFVPILYGAYGMALSAVALGERFQRSFDLRLPAAAAAALALVPALCVQGGSRWVPALILWAVLALPVYRFFSDESSPRVERLVGHLVAGFFLLAALLVLGKDQPVLCAVLWIMYFVSRALSRAFPPA